LGDGHRYDRKDGKDGKDGKGGKDGKDGKDGGERKNSAVCPVFNNLFIWLKSARRLKSDKPVLI